MMIDCVFKRNIAHLCQIGNIFEKIFLCRIGVCHHRQVVALQCPDKPTLYVDPSGSSYCRYMGIEL
ncbi:MAG: hypothetical protein J6N45_02975 [Alphaproteobacteria bacterium]|nr:hypothetical protein [Alphaproteobacteria bacterium]